MNLIEVFLWCVVFFGIHIYMHRRVLAKQQLEIEQAVEKQMANIRIVEAEQHGTIEYWFDKNNSEFIAQGKNLDELISHAKSRFPEHCFFFNQNEQWYKISGPDWSLEQVKMVKIDKK